MSDIDITLTESGSKGRYVARPDPNGTEAELTFSRASDRLVIIDHTAVPDGYRETGLGLKLVERAVEDARKGGYKIMPLCPFAAAQFRRHANWRDVLNG